jgi:monolysocardiolipin acyltransferase
LSASASAVSAAAAASIAAGQTLVVLAFWWQAMDEPGLNLARAGVRVSRATITAVAALSAVFLKYFSRLRVHGRDRFTQLVASPRRDDADSRPRAGRPLITVSNHASCLDDPLLWGALPWADLLRTSWRGHMRWTPGSRRICYANPLFGYFFGLGQVTPVSWGEGIFQPGMRIAQEQLDRGGWVHIFPEGRVNQSGRIYPCKWGVGQLVLETARRHGASPLVLILAHTGACGSLSLSRALG